MRPQTFSNPSIPGDAHRMALHELPSWITLIDFTANLLQLATFLVALRAFPVARRNRDPHQRPRQLAEPPTFWIYQGRPLTLVRRCRTNLRRWVPTVIPGSSVTTCPTPSKWEPITHVPVPSLAVAGGWRARRVAAADAGADFFSLCLQALKQSGILLFFG